MRFFFADSQDFVDPGFDFEREEFSADRRPQRGDLYPHEFFDKPPYDGMLVSRAVVGDERWKGKYTTAQSMRFRRDGARAFLRYTQAGASIMGDCGAFSYIKLPQPPYTVPEMVDYYLECGFTHAVSIDHVILQYSEDADESNLLRGAISRDDLVTPEIRSRYEITLSLAEQFLDRCQKTRVPFRVLGVAQGWSPASYREAVRRLADMGYDYVAIGGLVPLKVPQIKRILNEVRGAVPDRVRLHLFGFTKADNIGEFLEYGIESFDSTSPLLRAFKDSTKNYLSSNRWYTAIRIPRADENLRFKKEILAGYKNQRQLRAMEERALKAARDYAADRISVEDALQPILAYGREFSQKVSVEAYRETLAARPWAQCPCRACTEAGIEVLIFRGSNRNRRRGFHNLWEFHRQLRSLRESRGLLAHAV